ncbi:MAG: transcription antitermination factor NusB [Ilumatobacteraceae bacterium]
MSKPSGTSRSVAPSTARSSARSAARPNAGSTGARRVALDCLLRIDHDGAYANLVIGPILERSGLDQRDRRFVTDLVYGTTRMRRACDALVDRFLTREPPAEVRSALRLGAYQLVFAGVSAHAAVGETVNLVPKSARGFVNAVLRRVASTPMNWPSTATRLSYPDWIVERLNAELGVDDATSTLEVMNTAAFATARDDGYVQDAGSQLAAAAVEAVSGDLVLDMCAAPGGKATAMSAAGAFVIAADVSPVRSRLVAANVHHLGSDVAPVAADGLRSPFPPGCFDRVLLDAPCSGLGTLRRRPDARWRITAADVGELVELQRGLLAAAASLVRPGGMLVYSVCTLLAAESVDHRQPEGFDVITATPAGPWAPYAHGFRLLPHLTDTDGMILLRYRRSQ